MVTLTMEAINLALLVPMIAWLVLMQQPVWLVTQLALSVQLTDAIVIVVSSSTGLSVNPALWNVPHAIVHRFVLPVSAPGCFRLMPASALINSIQWLELPLVMLVSIPALLVFPQLSVPVAILPWTGTWPQHTVFAVWPSLMMVPTSSVRVVTIPVCYAIRPQCVWVAMQPKIEYTTLQVNSVNARQDTTKTHPPFFASSAVTAVLLAHQVRLVQVATPRTRGFLTRLPSPAIVLLSTTMTPWSLLSALPVTILA